MIEVAIILLIVYSLVAFAGYRNVPIDQLTNSDLPHWLLVQNLFGDVGKMIMVVLAITATCSTINTAEEFYLIFSKNKYRTIHLNSVLDLLVSNNRDFEGSKKGKALQNVRLPNMVPPLDPLSNMFQEDLKRLYALKTLIKAAQSFID